MIVFPGFQLLDIAGPKDAFAVVKDLSQGAFQYDMLTVGTTRSSVLSSSGLEVVPDRTIFDPCPHFDTVIVPGGPGDQSYFDLARKDCVGTARNTTSKVWFTVADGVLSDVYWPTVDATNVHTLQYLVSDGSTFTDLQPRDMTYQVVPDPTGMSCTVVATSAAHHYTLTTTYITDPSRDTVLMRTRFNGPAADQLYVRLDPLAGGTGGREDDAAHGQGQVGRRGDDGRVVAAEFEQGPPEPGRDPGGDGPAHPGRSGRADQGDARIIDQGFADIGRLYAEMEADAIR